jgi:hypothetical protein
LTLAIRLSKRRVVLLFLCKSAPAKLFIEWPSQAVMS